VHSCTHYLAFPVELSTTSMQPEAFEVLRKFVEPKMADAIKKNLRSLVREEKKIHLNSQPKRQPAKTTKIPAPKQKRNTTSAAVRMTSGPPVISSLPKLRSKIEMRPGPNHNSVRVSIVDYVGPIVLPDITPERGTILFTQAFSPSRISGSKMSTISSMYERYVVNRLVFHYSAACPTTVGGALVMAFDKDSADTTFSGEPGIRHAVGLSSMTQFAPWEHATLLVEKENQQTFYFTSSTDEGSDSDRLEYMGALFVLATTPGTLVAEQAIGDLWVEAEVTFYDPTWEPTDVSGVLDQPTDGGHTMSLTAYQGFVGTENDSVVTATNMTFEPDGTAVGLSQNVPGWVVLSDNRYTANDSMIGLATTVRITGEVLTALPLGSDRRVRPDYASHAIAFQPTFENSDTSATQTNWSANFQMDLPHTIFSDDGDGGYHSVTKWYIVSSLIGTVGGTYTGRNLTLSRAAGFGIPYSMRRTKHYRLQNSKRLPQRPATVLPATQKSSGKSEVNSGPEPKTPQWVKIQISE
jgi:hypothetical protein